MTRIFCCTLFALFLGAVSAQAQARATVNGVVVGPAGMPQANVTVIITNAAGIDRRAVSDAMGQVVFGGLQPGAYRLRTEDDTFAPFTQDLMLAGGQTQAVRIALQPRVPVAAPPTQRATLAGTVIGPDGRPRGNVTVILTNPAGVDRRAVSEATGAYIFGGLQPGTYKLRIEDSGPDAQPFAVDSLPLMPGEQRQFDVRLQIVIVAPPRPTTPTGAPKPDVKADAGKKGKEKGIPASLVPEVTAPGGEFQALPNRWNFDWPTYKRYADDDKQVWVVGRTLDPYNQNKLKGDFPVFGSRSLFMNTNLQLNTALNPRQVGKGEAQSQFFNNNNFVGSVELFRGDTVFQPKSWAVRGTIVGNINDNTVAGETATQHTYGIEEAFAEKRLAVLNTSFDFVSIRGGMQNFNSDFRGYLFFDNQLGVRLFGNARSNRDQYNVAFFSMRVRDPVSQLHSFDSRDQTVVIGNYFIQDFAVPGYTAMFNVHVNHDNGVPNDPHALQVTYAGFHGDGKWGPWSVSHAFYQAFGTDDDNRVARTLNGGNAAPVDISAQMAALEVSRDADWLRYRGSLFFASGDDRSDPTKAHGFDSITDNPNIAGGQFMFWDQQNTSVAGLVPPNAKGPVVSVLSEKFSLYPDLRSRFTDRSNFVNPGLLVLNGGVDLRMSPKLKVVTNVSYLKFANAEVLRQLVAKNGGKGFEDETIGLDISAAAKYRPFLNENMFFVLGFSSLSPKGGFATALGSTGSLYSFVGAIQLAY